MQRAYFRSCACAGTRTPLGLPLRGPVGYVRDIAFSPDRKLIAAAGSRPTVIWDTTTRKTVKVFPGELMVRRRSRSARTASPWQSHAPTQSLRCTTSEPGTRRASLSVTGSLAISTSAQTESFSRRQPWGGAGACSSGTSRARGSPPHSQAHSPRMPFACRRGTESSSLSATAPAKSCAGSLTHHIEGAWAARPVGQELTGHNGAWILSTSNPGSTLVTLSDDGKLRLWDVASRKLIGAPLPAANSGGSVHFFPDGKHVLGVFGSSTGIVWSVEPAAWAAKPCSIAHRNLTPGGWTVFLGQRGIATCVRSGHGPCASRNERRRFRLSAGLPSRRAPVAQWIAQRFPRPRAQVRFMPGTLNRSGIRPHRQSRMRAQSGVASERRSACAGSIHAGGTTLPLQAALRQ
jgi:WD domain, G-beta repeat